jgi:hypothetical protein
MQHIKQNPGLAPRASRNQLVGWLHLSPTASEQQAQTLACRFCLSPWMARDMARLCFGEGCRND